MATQRELSRPQAASGAADLSAPGDLSSSAASFARYLRAANIAPATLKTYAEAVQTLAGFLAERGMPTDVAAISREHLEAFITDQLARWRPATAANRYRGLQRLFAGLVEEGEIRVSPVAPAVKEQGEGQHRRLWARIKAVSVWIRLMRARKPHGPDRCTECA